MNSAIRVTKVIRVTIIIRVIMVMRVIKVVSSRVTRRLTRVTRL